MRSLLCSAGLFAAGFRFHVFHADESLEESSLIWKDSDVAVDWWCRKKKIEQFEFPVIMTPKPKKIAVSSAEFYYMSWIHLYSCTLKLENADDLSLVHVSLHDDDDVIRIPIELELVYSRSIPKGKIIENAVYEMNFLMQQNGKPFPSDWLTELENLNIPDVDEATVLRAEMSSLDGKLTLFSGDRVLGSSRNREFAKAFLGIWLSENSRNSKLAMKLLRKD